ALRVLEEYSKLFSASAGSEFKKIRFKLYTLEKKSCDFNRPGKK
ncbi:MAG: thiamine phosphate synthase, partial [Elusimicrobia bacterium]|nr:thiamine phosphate synthase [Elusimicrobiota bacterium]